jgi:peptide/nickel transport system substrate-binding protein
MDVELQTADQNALVIDIFTRNYSISCFGAVGQEDPDLAYYNTLHSESPTNATGYSNPEVDEALDTGRRSTDEETRRESYRVVQQALAEDVPLFQAVTSPWGWFGSGDVRGLFARRNGTIVLADAWLAP